MRTDKKISRYMEKNKTNEVKNYKKMCEILHEKEKRGKSEKGRTEKIFTEENVWEYVFSVSKRYTKEYFFGTWKFIG